MCRAPKHADCVAVICRLQCVAVCCSVLQCCKDSRLFDLVKRLGAFVVLGDLDCLTVCSSEVQ